MNRALLSPSMFFIAAVLAGCQSGSKTFSGVEGVYEGKGKFTADAGSMQLEGKLELAESGRYRLEIKPLGSLGREEGTWKQSGEQVTLTPAPIQGETVLNAMSTAKQPKVWNLDQGYSAISLNDGPMSIRLVRK